jgi:hypothetical protein
MKRRSLILSLILVAIVAVIALKLARIDDSSGVGRITGQATGLLDNDGENRPAAAHRNKARPVKEKVSIAQAHEEHRKFYKDPKRFAERIRIWDIPGLLDLPKSEQEGMLNLMSNIGQSYDLPVGLRYQFIREHTPIEYLDKTVDDMIRLLPADQIAEMSIALSDLPQGEPRMAVYRLFFVRIGRLKLPESTIEGIRESLETAEEKAMFQEEIDRGLKETSR